MLSADPLGEKLGVSGRQIRLLAERRAIPYYRVGPRSLRFDESEVMKVISVKADERERRPQADR